MKQKRRAFLKAALCATAAGGLAFAGGCRFDIDLRTRTSPLDPDEAPPVVHPTPVGPRFEVLDDDPFGDGVRATALFLHDGALWIGPSKDGTSAARYSPTGDGKTLVAFSITGDDTTANHAASVFTSFGAPGCQPNTTSCGPDNEEGPVLLQSAVLDGSPTLVAAGGKGRGGFHDVYVGALDDDAGVARFTVLDLGAAAGPDAKGVSFAHAYDGGVALGLPQHGASRAHVANVTSTSSSPGGFDVRGAVAARNVDSMALLGATAVVASGSGISRSDQGLDDAAFVDVTPPSFDAARSLDVEGNTAQPARERAVPALATLDDGAVLLARNTVDGPELWTCAAGCDAGDWASRTVTGDRVSALVRVGAAAVLAVDDDEAGAHFSVSYDGNLLRAVDGLDDLAAQRVLAATGALFDGQAWLYALVADDADGAARLVRILVPPPDEQG